MKKKCWGKYWNILGIIWENFGEKKVGGNSGLMWKKIGEKSLKKK